MIFYLLFIFLATLLVVLAYLFPDKSKIFQIVLFVLAVCVSGFRDNISGDFRAYVSWYLHKTRDLDFEFGFVCIMNFFRWFNGSYHIVFFFFSFCTVILIFLGIKKYTSHCNLAFLFFLLIPTLYLNSWSIIRQALVVSLAFISFHFLITKKYLIYLVLMFVGISIHYTAIVPFLVFIAVYKYGDKIKTVHLAAMLFFSLVLSQFQWFPFFSNFFDNTRYLYYFSENNSADNIPKIIVLNGLGIFLLLYFEKMKAVYPVQKYFIILCLISIMVTNVFAKVNQLDRFSHYFTIFEIVVFADLIFLELKNRRVVLLVGFYIYGVSLFLHTIKTDYNINDQGTKYIPYDSIFYKFEDDFFMMGTDCLVDPSLDKEEK